MSLCVILLTVLAISYSCASATYNHRKPKFITKTYKPYSQSTKYIGEELVQLDPLEMFLTETREAASNVLFSGNDNDKCSNEDPMNEMTTPQLIARNGYMALTHKIFTEDGYILTIHRIPYAKNSKNKVSPRRAVLLQHGILSSSADWVVAGPERGLAYILADAGYDVWLANARGNTYSKGHLYKNVESSSFWRFTFHEISQYDLPAVIEFIRSTKGEGAKIDYIGHSMGTTVLFALLSTRPQYNHILRAGFALAPVVYMSGMPNEIRSLAQGKEYIKNEVLKNFGMENEFLAHDGIVSFISQYSCNLRMLKNIICMKSMNIMCGHFNESLLPMILSHAPSGMSTETLVHYAQITNNGGRFQMYDFGPHRNFHIYGSYEPPEYPVQNITLPIALLSAKKDILTSDADLQKLIEKLPNVIEHYVVPSREFDHLDFLWGDEAPSLLYDKLLQLLAKDVNTY